MTKYRTLLKVFTASQTPAT